MSRAILRYSLLAYGISWVLVSPLVLQGLGLAPFHISPLWHGLGALGPVLAAFAMRRASDRTTGLSDLYRRQEAWQPARFVSAALLASPLVLGLVALGVLWAFGGDLGLSGLTGAFATPQWLASMAVGSVLYGLGEEPGWRGWLLPHLQRETSAVKATILLSFIWAGWHVPFFFYRFAFQGPATFVGFFVGLLAGAFWLTFVFNSTGGSVWTVTGWHMLWNVVSQAALEMSMPFVAVLNTLMIVLGFGVAVVWGRRGLCHRASHTDGGPE